MKETEPEQKTVKIFYLLTFVLPILTIFGSEMDAKIFPNR